LHSTKGKKMKTSHKILVFAGMVPMFIVILTVLSMKDILEDTGDMTVPYNDSHPKVTKEVLVKDFSKISTDGRWGIHIIQGDEFSVELEAPEKIIDEIKLEKLDDTLFLVSRDKPFSKVVTPRASITLPSISETYLQASIIVPSISEMHLHGMTNLDLSGFDSETITIDSQDVSTISWKDSVIQQLVLTGNGILFLDMYDTTVTNAHINYNGLYNVKMAIAGGRLSGQISGIGTLHCRGDVGINDIEVMSPGRIVFTE
jgi:hypothetical protein